MNVMYLLGYDIGTSSIKACILNASTGEVKASDNYPKTELSISAPYPGWAEQDPEMWWECVVNVTRKLLSENSIDKKDIKAIGISYQMHGLVLVDKNQKVLHPSIIWCDSRAVEIGNKAIEDLSSDYCLSHMLNSPGNFTASKLRWVKENEPDIFSKIHKIMLPGDYIAMKLTGKISSTITGLSEGIFWDFKNGLPSEKILKYYGIPASFLPEINDVFSVQGNLSSIAANELGLDESTVVSYRAGDQPNNAFSLNVLNPGEVAATAGTSGVIYGVADKLLYDPQSRVNTFAHVNHTPQNTSLGVLLCINGTGIANNWTKNVLLAGTSSLTYNQMNEMAQKATVGSDGLFFFPYGNGAERSLRNIDPSASFQGLSFNKHGLSHILRSVQEGIVFSMNYGLDIMKSLGMPINTIKVGQGNMFLSSVFTNAFATVTGCEVEMYNTDGAQGAARGAGLGSKIYKNEKEAFIGFKKIMEVQPDLKLKEQYDESYQQWLQLLEDKLNCLTINQNTYDIGKRNSLQS